MSGRQCACLVKMSFSTVDIKSVQESRSETRTLHKMGHSNKKNTHQHPRQLSGLGKPFAVTRRGAPQRNYNHLDVDQPLDVERLGPLGSPYVQNQKFFRFILFWYSLTVKTWNLCVCVLFYFNPLLLMVFFKLEQWSFGFPTTLSYLCGTMRPGT